MRRILFSAFFLLLSLSACSGEIEPGVKASTPAVVKDLKLKSVEAAPVEEGESFAGTVASRDRGAVASRTDGVVERITVRAGAAVKKGDLLLTVAGNEAEDRLRGAEAGTAEARRSLAAARTRGELADKTFERYRRLFEREAATPQEMDRVSAELEEARQGVAAAEAAVARAQAGSGAAGTALSYGRVVAPYDARVVRLDVEEGSTVLPGTPLLVLDRAGGWEVRVEIPESQTGKIAVGDPVRVEIPSLGRSFPGRISEVEPASDPRSRSFRARAELPPGESLSSGLFARVIFPGGERSALLVPQAALVERGQLTGVYVVHHGILNYRLVKTGREIDARVEILSGLDAGETIVVEGVEKARSGARVEE